MKELSDFAMPLVAGLMLGGFFFGGLWWTVVKGLASPQPALWFLGSMVLRTGVLLTGFYFAGREDWRRWAMCLLGTVLARVMVKRLTRPLAGQSGPGNTEARHAP